MPEFDQPLFYIGNTKVSLETDSLTARLLPSSSTYWLKFVAMETGIVGLKTVRIDRISYWR